MTKIECPKCEAEHELSGLTRHDVTSNYFCPDCGFEDSDSSKLSFNANFNDMVERAKIKAALTDMENSSQSEAKAIAECVGGMLEDDEASTELIAGMADEFIGWAQRLKEACQ